jgi:cytochrome c biogenesis protein CcmG/thiol:disulfide interchange protein DsbE
MSRNWNLGLSLVLCGVACSAPARKPAPDFALKDSHGNTVRLSDYKGKVVLLNFWATWCGPCKIEEPWLIEFERKYRDRGFAILAVSMDEDGWPVVKPYISERKLNYRVVLSDEQIDRLYPGLEAWPTTFLIDRTGAIASRHVGLMPKQQIADAIEKLL